jgi:hypothetical protein
MSGGIIFSSVTDYVIQANRTKRRVKRDELDTLSEVWIGPSWEEDGFVPAIGTRHPDYNLMTVISTEVKRLPATVSEITINYQGKFWGSGTYVSAPTIEQYWMEGEVTYEVLSSISTGGTSSIQGVQQINRRYRGRCVDISYITNKRPTGNPTGIGLSKSYLGFLNIYDTAMSFQPGAVVGNSGVTTEVTCTNVAIRDRADGWYEVRETYQSRMFPFGGFISAGSVGGGGGSITGPILKTDTYQTAFNQMSYNMGQAAQNAWDNYRQAQVDNGNPDPGTAPTDNSPYGQQMEQLTGINPGWSSDMQGAASDAANSPGSF